MAFKIIKKFNADQIKSRNLNTGFFSKYYKGIEDLLVQKTGIEQTTEYFLCVDYTADEHLFVLGTPTAAQKVLFRAAAKGNEGFDEKKVSMGSCFILKKGKKNILCLYPNKSLSKATKKTVIGTLKKLQRSAAWKGIDSIKWLTSPLIIDAEDSSKVESVVEKDAPIGKQPAQLNKQEVEEQAKNIKRGVEKLIKDVMPRYKKRETTDKDAAFVKALRKAGNLFLVQLTQTDEATKNSFSSQKKILEAGLPQWRDLETRIHSQKGKVESTATLKKSLLKVIKTMNERRDEIKTILKRVDIKTF